MPICCSYYTGESSVKVEADSNDDITLQSHDDKPRPYSC